MTHLGVTKWWKGTEEDIWKALRYLSFLTKEKHNKVLSILGKNFIVELVCGAIFWSCFDWAFFHLIGGDLASSVALISYKWWNTRCLDKWKSSTINFFFMLSMNFSSEICRRLAPSPETLTRLTLTTSSSFWDPGAAQSARLSLLTWVTGCLSSAHWCRSVLDQYLSPPACWLSILPHTNSWPSCSREIYFLTRQKSGSVWQRNPAICMGAKWQLVGIRSICPGGRFVNTRRRLFSADRRSLPASRH